MTTRTTIVSLCMSILVVFDLQAATISLDDLPWHSVKGVALGDSRDSYAKQFGTKYPPMPLGQIELWPNTLSDNEMFAAGFREDRIVAVLWTWKRLSPERTRALTSSIFQYLNEQDKKPQHIPSQKIVGERIANILALSFGMPGKGAKIRALFTSSEVETTVIIHDGTSPDIEGAVNRSGSASLLKKDEEPVPVRDYLKEVVASPPGDANQTSPQTIPSNASRLSPTLKPSPAPKLSEATPSVTSEEPSTSTPWSIIVVLIVAAIALLWLLLKRRA